MAMTGEQVAAKWARRMKGATQDVRDGIEAVTTAPGVKAAAKANKMLEGIRKAVEDGTWQRAVAGVTLEEWKKAAIEKGVGRIAAGVDASMPQTTQMMTKLMGALSTIKSKVDKMPDDTFEDRMQRMVTQITEMHKVKLR